MSPSERHRTAKYRPGLDARPLIDAAMEASGIDELAKELANVTDAEECSLLDPVAIKREMANFPGKLPEDTIQLILEEQDGA